ncbi:hypothetical protein FNH58_22630 [Salmonella enterica subsp. houtenae]|nr:hypothetical protein [Salmonella enterica subsp. houtenae]EKT1270756.1 hypothetical protein [Salmonella enterica]EKT1700471.1 hypothetical protein [Salmonella enterica]EKT3189036.1 hypothetical protein [Salmonella enterica]HAU3161426.1 hypothetical protein [Salmonella enterica subsp. houtenae]
MDELNKVIVIHPAQINLLRKFEYVSALLEKVDDIIKTDDEITRVTDGQHVRAHLRRGHWHGFCSGKKEMSRMHRNLRTAGCRSRSSAANIPERG